MSNANDLFDAIVKNPDDDAPRFAYADWLAQNGDPDRAEFIRLQIALENARSGDKRDKLFTLSEELLTKNRAAWLAPLRPILRPIFGPNRTLLDLIDRWVFKAIPRRSWEKVVEFRRGFVEQAW